MKVVRIQFMLLLIFSIKYSFMYPIPSLQTMINSMKHFNLFSLQVMFRKITPVIFLMVGEKWFSNLMIQAEAGTEVLASMVEKLKRKEPRFGNLNLKNKRQIN